MKYLVGMEALKLLLYIVVVVGWSTESFEGQAPSTSGGTLRPRGSVRLPGWLYTSQCTYICICTYILVKHQELHFHWREVKSLRRCQQGGDFSCTESPSHVPRAHPYLLDLVLHWKQKTKQDKIKAVADGGDGGRQPWPTQKHILFKWNWSGEAGEQVRGRAFWAPPKQTPIGRSGRRRPSPGRWASSGSVP